jgi:hypothetical protein
MPDWKPANKTGGFEPPVLHSVEAQLLAVLANETEMLTGL